MSKRNCESNYGREERPGISRTLGDAMFACPRLKAPISLRACRGMNRPAPSGTTAYRRSTLVVLGRSRGGLFGGYGGQGQGEMELGAQAQFALDPDAATVGVHDVLDNGQT